MRLQCYDPAWQQLLLYTAAIASALCPLASSMHCLQRAHMPALAR